MSLEGLYVEGFVEAEAAYHRERMTADFRRTPHRHHALLGPLFLRRRRAPRHTQRQAAAG